MCGILCINCTCNLIRFFSLLESVAMPLWFPLNNFELFGLLHLQHCEISIVFSGHKDPSQVSVRTPLSHLQEAPPEVIAAMVDEADWDFDILKLEKASNHRWVILVHLTLFSL